MLAGIVAKGLDGHDRARDAGFQTGCGTEKTKQTLVDTLAQFAQEFAVILEKRTQDNRDTEDVVPLRCRVKQVFAQVKAELHDLLGMN